VYTAITHHQFVFKNNLTCNHYIVVQQKALPTQSLLGTKS